MSSFFVPDLFADMTCISERYKDTSSIKDLNLLIGTIGTPSINSTSTEYRVNIIGIA
jgi:hypothetical protein